MQARLKTPQLQLEPKLAERTASILSPSLSLPRCTRCISPVRCLLGACHMRADRCINCTVLHAPDHIIACNLSCIACLLYLPALGLN